MIQEYKDAIKHLEEKNFEKGYVSKSDLDLLNTLKKKLNDRITDLAYKKF